VQAIKSLLVQAAAGGVGLKAVEYAHWLNLPCLGTAGRPLKHVQLRFNELEALASSRDGTAFSVAARLGTGARFDAVLNSLSLDFIAVSFAALREGGAFEEIGKRGIWASTRQLASSLSSTYCAIALDVDISRDMKWIRGVHGLISTRAQKRAATSLPLRSFNMEEKYETAFRTLQSGLNIGKIVVRLVVRAMGQSGKHVVTGGTSGLGLLTCRWLAQTGASHLILASRSGPLACHTEREWKVISLMAAHASVQQCDAGEVSHVRRLMATWPASSGGLWHAAGVIADSMLAKQDAAALSYVFAPKAHSLDSLHATIQAPQRSFVCFSSVSGLLGGAGQANYSAASTCLDALTISRRARGSAAVSVQWGAWAEVGMAARGAASERTAVQEAASGLLRISLADGLAALGTATHCNAPSLLSMLPTDWNRVATHMGTMPAFLSACAPKKANKTIDGRSMIVRLSLEMVLTMVQRTAGGVVDADAPLMEAGVDSLGAVELRNTLVSAS
jgi:NADPH:quinone reductase-like Zn-dependent oxidoreductase